LGKLANFGEKFSIAVKDVIAVAFVGEGIKLWESNNLVPGAVLLVIGGILFLVDQYL